MIENPDSAPLISIFLGRNVSLPLVLCDNPRFSPLLHIFILRPILQHPRAFRGPPPRVDWLMASRS